MCQGKAFAQMVDIWKFTACCLNRGKGFLILRSSLIRNSSLFSGDKFVRIVVVEKSGKGKEVGKCKEVAVKARK